MENQPKRQGKHGRQPRPGRPMKPRQAAAERLRMQKDSRVFPERTAAALPPLPRRKRKHLKVKPAAERIAAGTAAVKKSSRKQSKLVTALRSSFLFNLLLFTLTLFYFEIVLKCSTMRSAFGTNLLLIFTFSMSAAGILSLVSTLFSKKVNRIIKTAVLFLLMIPYGVEYFVYQEYNLFYDFNTVVNGAGGAATDFQDEIMRLVFSANGISHLLLLAVPAVLYLILGKKADDAESMNWVQRVTTAGLVLVCFLLGIGGVRLSERYTAFYDKEYSFPVAVSNFGLLTGLRLDISKGTGSQEIEFELEMPEVTTTAVTTRTTVTTGLQNETTTTTTTTTYGKNVMDIDFAAMAEQDGGGTWTSLDKYVASLTPSSKNQYTGMFAGKNLIFITCEAFTKEAIRKDLTPTLYRLWTKGIHFNDFYQPASAGTTGGEFQNVFGLLPMKGGASFPVFTQNDNVYLTMGSQLNRQGYWGKAYHNNSYTFYSRNKTHNRLGYSEGFMGYGNGMEKYVKYEWPESDKDMIEGTLQEYIDQEHFNVYYMSVSGHNGYDRGNAAARRNWEKVEDLEYSEKVKAYLAANIELENGLAVLVKALEEKGIADDTVICMTADHFPYGLDDNASYGRMKYLSELYGEDVTNTVQRDHNAAILWCGCLEEDEPIEVDAPASSLDLLPTLSNLFGLEYDSRLMPGRDVFSDAEAIYFDREYNWRTELGTYLSAKGTFTPDDEDAEIPDDYVERIKTIVRNKISYCQGVMDSSYIAHVLPVTQ
ncbi:MAG: LTA synthase family protein [Oscillospiraceae bacterium]|nr:LTA synthase family protein [Oscillospiraceae bacterium]